LGFPGKAVDEIKSEIIKYKESIDRLNQFEKENKSDMDKLAKGLSIPDYQDYHKDLVTGSDIFQKFVTDYDQTYGKNLVGLAATVSQVQSLEFYKYYGPFSMRGEDELLIKVAKLDIQNSNDDDLKSFPGILIKRRGGVKIDFSAGIFGSNLSDRSYVSSQSTRITQDTTIVDGAIQVGPHQTTFSKVLRRGGSSFSYGPMAFVHFHSMNSSLVNYGVYIGTGLMFKDSAKPVLSVGGNLMLVSFQRLIFGFGAAFANETRLSSKYIEGNSYAETITDVPTENHLSVKALFSLSWNISK